ncbi:YciI family protein [Rhodoferax sp. TBRC 17660]|uniref:YciI family protein n=1 Tax=Rhodoferax potami TaxID=3068338 RepID=A0ABU3KP32_9BURK|nr:YciI family protein [Rhodoferax sp. TBRC 17660]MDT7519231.1 YciI family protein [Rhodoferax sp. TBRC 17660]
MKYLLLCQMQPAALTDVPDSAMQQMMQAMMAYNQQLIQAGVLIAAGQLAPPESAQRVFAEKGRIKTEEGFALKGDTQIGGYYLIDVPGEPEATGWAAKCPATQFGALEVRQVAYSPV